MRFNVTCPFNNCGRQCRVVILFSGILQDFITELLRLLFVLRLSAQWTTKVSNCLWSSTISSWVPFSSSSISDDMKVLDCAAVDTQIGQNYTEHCKKPFLVDVPDCAGDIY